ncbi:MAG: superoxide dismutase, partial [Parcubacteria group bacterium]|nr:superoxide dismutase [Parcubacteria group bacterium]
MPKKLYTLPKLPYNYKDLEPIISKETLTIHHTKHHAGYVKGANGLLEKLDSTKNLEAKSLSFNVSGHILHSLFWENMQPPKEKNTPTGKIALLIKKDFGSFEKFKKLFSE